MKSRGGLPGGGVGSSSEGRSSPTWLGGLSDLSLPSNASGVGKGAQPLHCREGASSLNPFLPRRSLRREQKKS